ncbi:hypothetical protein EDEG_03833 [Edhazardia aedis USNM 41457]|uniref:Uncharacterized protein n=1 Tax=Edhazardia aedis (strain USNM 41457) TaxID=1003232 RepID=J9DJU8_EDHAE|nr:hypothetical protein EDEG_03833 [Edhazardia aedis USNM 41457]|eukprot:EJW01617.1 hypothetical protein EDEG_03833 [Edhazardia aedis USNM 41457]
MVQILCLLKFLVKLNLIKTGENPQSNPAYLCKERVFDELYEKISNISTNLSVKKLQYVVNKIFQLSLYMNISMESVLPDLNYNLVLLDIHIYKLNYFYECNMHLCMRIRQLLEFFNFNALLSDKNRKKSTKMKIL